LFNIAVRLVGAGFVFVGAVFAIWGLFLVLDPKATIGVNGVPSNDPWIKAMVLVVGLVVGVLGVLLVFARPPQPTGNNSASSDK
jgi:hypothetical protein